MRKGKEIAPQAEVEVALINEMGIEIIKRARGLSTGAVYLSPNEQLTLLGQHRAVNWILDYLLDLKAERT